MTRVGIWPTPSHTVRCRAQPVQVAPHATLRSQSHRINPSQHHSEIFNSSKGTDLKCNPSAPYLEQMIHRNRFLLT